MTDFATAALERLNHLATIVATGPGSKEFLQGQLSFDLDKLTESQIELASCNSAQGRVQAVVWLVQRSDAIVMLLPTSMVDTTLTRLRKYVLRARVRLEAGADRFAVFATDLSMSSVPDRAHVAHAERSYVQWPGHRVLAIAPSTSGDSAAAGRLQKWRLADIAAGLPQVHPETHEAFVAQMLNIDLLGGIGFDKGCYTGQEIIARTHYRGAIKRRMFQFRAQCAPPPPGTRIVVSELHAGDVVEAVETDDGCELLAVVNLAQMDQPLTLTDSHGATLTRQALPYQV